MCVCVCVCVYHYVQNPEDNDEDDFKILSSDNLLIIGRADDEFSSVEVHGQWIVCVLNSWPYYLIFH